MRTVWLLAGTVREVCSRLPRTVANEVLYEIAHLADAVPVAFTIEPLSAEEVARLTAVAGNAVRSLPRRLEI